MMTGRRIVLGLRVTLLATAVLLPSEPSWADGCSLDDLWQSIDSASSAITSGACASACADTGSAGCIAAGAITAGLGAAAASQGQSSVGVFCSQINNAQSNLGPIQSWLSAAGVSQDVVNALGSVGDPLSVLQCSCDLEQGIDRLASAVGACFQDVICGLQEDLGWGGCSCQPPPPVMVSCTPPPQCTTNNSLPGCDQGIYARLGDNPAGYTTKQVSNGQIAIDDTDGWDGHSTYCAPDHYCFCPSPMRLVPENNLQADGWDTANGYVIFYCECPKLGPGQNTHAAAASGALAKVCICDDTGLPAVPPVKSTINPTGSICPIPLTGIPCPKGQTNWNGKCVLACAKNEVKTPDGTCCNPSSVTYCGQCCPQGWIPDPVEGICIRQQQTQ